MQTNLSILMTLILIGCTTREEQCTSQIRMDVELLASDSLQGREVGTEGEKMASAFVANRFQEMGLTPAGTNGYYQPFFVKESQNPHDKATLSSEDTIRGTHGKNVIAFLDNPGHEIVVVGAHYDHLGYGGFSSLHRGDSAIHNGADDNASGVAALLSIAEDLAKHPTHRDMLFIAFSGEEKGLWGSNYFTKNPTIDLSKVNFMINMDMIGRLDTARGIAIHGTGTAPNWPEIIDTTNTVGLKILKKESGIGPSDHTSFYLLGIPVLHFFTGQHEDYHRPTDDSELINFEGIQTISSHIVNIIRLLDDQPKLTFQKTIDESTKSPRFSVTLGVVPDYMYDEKGMRIDGISDNKPAQNAGLKKGDVVIQLGDSIVTDIMSYMSALSVFVKGDTTYAIVKRNEEKQTFHIEF